MWTSAFSNSCLCRCNRSRCLRHGSQPRWRWKTISSQWSLYCESECRRPLTSGNLNGTAGAPTPGVCSFPVFRLLIPCSCFRLRPSMYGLSADTSTITVKRNHQGRDETPIDRAPTVGSLAELAHAGVCWGLLKHTLMWHDTRWYVIGSAQEWDLTGVVRRRRWPWHRHYWRYGETAGLPCSGGRRRRPLIPSSLTAGSR